MATDLPSNSWIEYVHYETGEVLHIDHYHDPDLGWARDTMTGGWKLQKRHSGQPTTEWLRNNPMPR